MISSLSTIIDDTIERTKKLLNGYSVNNLHKALLYSATYVAVRNKGLNLELVKPLEKTIPRPLVYQARRVLVPMFVKILDLLERRLKSNRLVVINDSNIEKLVKDIQKVFRRNIEYVMVYDCMSLIEFILIAAFSRFNNLESIIPDTIFINPTGLTRYVTQQLTYMNYKSFLREFAYLLMKELDGHGYRKNAYIDFKVHEYGSLGIAEYVTRLNIERIAKEVLSIASNKTTLVTADHGYDIIYDPDNNYLYTTHGFRESIKGNHRPVLLLSRFSFLLNIYSKR